LNFAGIFMKITPFLYGEYHYYLQTFVFKAVGLVTPARMILVAKSDQSGCCDMK